MKKGIFFLLLIFISPLCVAQTYKYIGVEDGLSNRRVYAIQKGPKGYMWFLTHNGIDRYDGKDFKQYQLTENDTEINSMLNLSWLYVGADNTLWEIGRKGKIFRYDVKHDRFQFIYKLPEEVVKGNPSPVSYSFIDTNNVIWLCNEENVYLYDIGSQKSTIVKNQIGEIISNVKDTGNGQFVVGTDAGIHHAELQEDKFVLLPCEKLDSLKIQVTELYLHRKSKKLFIGTFQKGVYLYDMNSGQVNKLNTGLEDVNITCIRAFNDNEILIATDGAGVHKMDIGTYGCEPYITADYSSHNAMNGNSIYDLLVDGNRIWMANHPIGITVRNNQYSSYQWIKHSIGNRQSIINDQVNAIVEDHDGDLWFATNNGISLYTTKDKRWHSILSVFDERNLTKNHVFISLYEVEPGIIWAGGYSSGIYQIDKKRMKADFFIPSASGNGSIRPDKYIRSITKTSDGSIWLGEYNNLKRINIRTKDVQLYPNLNSITDIIEKDERHMWIGTATGLYLLDKRTGQYQHIAMPIESFYINALYQNEEGLLYIGTSNSGLLAYNFKDKSFEHFHKDNCALISNNIYTILPNDDKSLLLSTENSLTSYYPDTRIFHNWTKEQGLSSDHFNPTSGTLRKNGNFILGSTDGAIEFKKDMMIPRDYKYRMVFSDFRVFYQTVYPGDKSSPLEVDIDETKTLRLKYNQNIFSLRVSSINYDYPSLLLYSWKLEGFYDEWSRPEKECRIRFTNLNPGKYTLRARTISSEDQRIVLEERSIDIVIEQPFWLSPWAMLVYAALIAAIAAITFRILILRKQRKISEEKIRFFINTAHDIRTPLTLIKAPLEELSKKESLTPDGHNNMNTAIRNVNALLRLTTNLINFERADTYSETLHVAEYELNTYMEELTNIFRTYADVKRVSLTYESNFRYMNVWLDKDKMDSILKNLISNALKYTPEGGDVHIFTSGTEECWSVEVRDTGIGIPASEQKKLFKMHFRGSNAINSKVTGSGIGLLLVGKLVRLHKGKINFSSTEGAGSCIKVTFPKGEKHYRKEMHNPKPEKGKRLYTEAETGMELPPSNLYENRRQEQPNRALPKVLIVEDNDELREYLRHTLSDNYDVQVCNDGKAALNMVKEYMPEMIISDIMMPEMRGDEMCHILKNDIETSHIPIILLTALNTERNIIEGLNTGADEYIVKPFNVGILRATVANILTNRALLRRKYAQLALGDGENGVDGRKDDSNGRKDDGNGKKDDDNSRNDGKENSGEPTLEDAGYLNELDRKFIATTRKHVEENINNPALNVDMICALLNMSRTSFYNKLKALTDQAPADYIRLIRLKRAAQLLKEQRYSITEVAEMTGFNDAKYFREVFKKHFKVSPSQYGKQEER